MKERKRQTVFPLPRSPFFPFHEVGRKKFIFPSVVGAYTSTPFCFSPSCPLFFSFSNQSKAQVGYFYFTLSFVLIIDNGYFIIIKLLLLLTYYLTL